MKYVIAIVASIFASASFADTVDISLSEVKYETRVTDYSTTTTKTVGVTVDEWDIVNKVVESVSKYSSSTKETTTLKTSIGSYSDPVRVAPTISIKDGDITVDASVTFKKTFKNVDFTLSSYSVKGGDWDLKTSFYVDENKKFKISTHTDISDEDGYEQSKINFDYKLDNDKGRVSASVSENGSFSIGWRK